MQEAPERVSSDVMALRSADLLGKDGK